MNTGYEVCIKLLADNTVITIIISALTLLAAIYIPRKVMVDQSFIALTEQYRSPEMGFAIMSLFRFYKVDCEQNPDLIEEKYIKRYKDEVEKKLVNGEINPAHTLLFQRRLVAYFYWDLAKLYFESWFPRLAKRKFLQMVGPNERKLISIVLHTASATASCFYKIDIIPEPSDDDVNMNQLIKRLYDKVEDWL